MCMGVYVYVCVCVGGGGGEVLVPSISRNDNTQRRPQRNW